MNVLRTRPTSIVIAIAAAATVMCLSDRLTPSARLPGFSQTSARIGRPLTPMSYAGVARRTTRRAVVGGAAVAGAAAVPYYAAQPYGATGCIQVVDAYGRISYRCP
jgi:hypothetical protein